MKRKLKGDPLIISCFAGIGKTMLLISLEKKDIL